MSNSQSLLPWLKKTNTDLVKYYISLFEGAFLIKALEKFSDKTIKIKSSSPIKFKEKYPRANLILVTPDNYAEFEVDPLKFLEAQTR